MWAMILLNAFSFISTIFASASISSFMDALFFISKIMKYVYKLTLHSKSLTVDQCYDIIKTLTECLNCWRDKSKDSALLLWYQIISY